MLSIELLNKVPCHQEPSRMVFPTSALQCFTEHPEQGRGQKDSRTYRLEKSNGTVISAWSSSLASQYFRCIYFSLRCTLVSVMTLEDGSDKKNVNYCINKFQLLHNEAIKFTSNIAARKFRIMPVSAVMIVWNHIALCWKSCGTQLKGSELGSRFVPLQQTRAKERSKLYYYICKYPARGQNIILGSTKIIVSGNEFG